MARHRPHLATARLLAALGIVTVSAAHAARAQSSQRAATLAPADSSACSAWRVAADRGARTARGQPAYVEQPASLRLAAGAALLGRPSLIWQDSAVFASIDSAGHGPEAGAFALAGLLLDPALTPHPIPMPPGVTMMLAPRAVHGPGGAAEVFWGSTASLEDGAEPAATDVWHATFDGTGWSTPERIFHAATMRWTITGPSVVGGSALTVAVPASAPGGGVDHDGVAIIRRAGGAWAVSWIDVHTMPPNTAALASLGGPRLLLVFVGSVWSPVRQLYNAVFSARSSDGGATWTEPAVVLPYGDLMVNELQFGPSPSAELHLFWLRRVNPGHMFSDSVEHAVSRDAGATWTFLPGLGGAPEIGGLAIGPLPGGDLAIAARSVSADSLVLGVWGADGWRVPSHPPLSAAQSSPRFFAPSAGSLWLAWGTARRGAVPQFASALVPELRLAAFQRRCSSDTEPHDSLP